ncbi:hypothetical protein KZZ52_26080 [Dactylosporangium sp. AC04546]|uniref:hypothetical protein n=1 Tax=Dactylosporangium sp. AC04546 TaxID=2862460 RepID=UPI001EDCF683|nr:hypothetical protein [Dactylosporangium sp. AC04546]WVK88740.1 hypothetical protein KZZ52_26080 [Dactylosporangium sp. AC04546]
MKLHDLTRRQRILTVVTAGVIAAGLLSWLAWPEPAAAPPRERQYKATTACLLTDEHDLRGDLAKAAWAGMREASEATLIKVQYLAITGPQTPANGLTFYNTLGGQRCTVIVAAGDLPVAAMVQGLSSFPQIKQVTIGGDPQGKPVTVIDPTRPDTIAAGVKSVVAAAA